MKKAVLWMIAAMMILGSLKTFASEDLTPGKLAAVAQDNSDAAEFDLTIRAVNEKIEELNALQANLDDDILGVRLEEARNARDVADRDLSLNDIKSLSSDLDVLIKEARTRSMNIIKHELN